MSDEAPDDPSEWIHYQEFAEDRSQKYSHMLEQFELGGGPGPPFDFPEPPDFFPPPPPIPGSVEECETFSSHFDNCDISKVKYFKHISASRRFSLKNFNSKRFLMILLESRTKFPETCEALCYTWAEPTNS